MNLYDRAMAWLDSSDSLVAHWLRAAREALLGEMPVLAGGTALFAIFAVVPTLAAVVAVYSFIADPVEINSHLKGLEEVLPQNVVNFLGEQLARQASRSQQDLGFAVAISVGVAVLSARGAANGLVDSLNRAYRVRERRGTLHKIGVTLAMAASTLVGLVVMVAAVVALPGIYAMMNLADYGVVHWVRWPVLMLVAFLSLMLLYRFAPSPRPLGTERHLWPGSLLSTLLLVLVSYLLSLWVDHVANYNVWYGAFGSVVVVLLWFYVSTLAIVIGGFLNAELERHAGAPQPDRSMY
ncbi:MAG: YihY/virulence factor BrkB family protein [Deltaproteobacteria bacterium]|nr:YihY/virulence factor BrkB family protein [Deltaproteobacteria bacterium]